MVTTLKEMSDKEYYKKRLQQLDLERNSFISHWKELQEYVLPRRGRFWVSDRNKGTRRYQAIINSKGTQALRVAMSGMLAGTMSPTRPWFALETHDPDMMESQSVKEWLYQVEGILRTIFNDSNFYGESASMLKELLLFGTGCMSHVNDFLDVARFYTHTVGAYWISQNARFKVDTLGREFDWTVAQVIGRFGLENCSQRVKNANDQGNYEQWVTVCQLIEPNNDFRPSSPFAQDKAYKSVYFEKGSTDYSDSEFKFLDVSGYDEFPAYIPRWEKTDGDIYGTSCPGMESLGDVKQLQIMERRKAQAIDKMVNPPLHGPASVRSVPIDALPGGSTLYDAGTGQKLEPIYQVDPRLNDMHLAISQVESRIETGYFNDLFLAITNMEGIQPRNQLDLIQRNEERLLQLGPVLESLQGEWLDPLIERTFNQAARAGILPPIPEPLQGTNLRVKYISTLAIAQRAVATQTLERMSGYAGSLIQLGFNGAMDKFDADQAMDEYSRAIGAPPTVIRSDEQVAVIREEQQEELNTEQALQRAGQVAQINKTFVDATPEQ